MRKSRTVLTFASFTIADDLFHPVHLLSSSYSKGKQKTRTNPFLKEIDPGPFAIRMPVILPDRSSGFPTLWRLPILLEQNSGINAKGSPRWRRLEGHSGGSATDFHRVPRCRVGDNKN